MVDTLWMRETHCWATWTVPTCTIPARITSKPTIPLTTIHENTDDFGDFVNTNGGYNVDETMGKLVPQLSSALDLLKHCHACSFSFLLRPMPMVMTLSFALKKLSIGRVTDNFVAMIRRRRRRRRRPVSPLLCYSDAIIRFLPQKFVVSPCRRGHAYPSSPDKNSSSQCIGVDPESTIGPELCIRSQWVVSCVCVFRLLFLLFTFGDIIRDNHALTCSQQ